MQLPTPLLLAAALIYPLLTAADPTFTKTISYVYRTHTAAQPTDCGQIYHHTNLGERCPAGCSLQKITYGSASPVYECKPRAAATSVQALPVVAHLSCHTALPSKQFTYTVTPEYGPQWMTCATRSARHTAYAPAATVEVVTKTA